MSMKQTTAKNGRRHVFRHGGRAVWLLGLCGCIAFAAVGVELDPLDMRWTFGAHEPYTMYRRVGRHCTGGIDGNAKWLKPWMDWFDAESPALMQELGFNWLHCRFYKGMGWTSPT